MDRLRVILLTPGANGRDVGEAFVSFKWAEALGRICDLTLLCFDRPEVRDHQAQLPHVRCVTWPEPEAPMRFPRMNSMLKPSWPVLSRHVRRWVRARLAAGERFDVAHMIMPQAPRYAVPFRGLGVPYSAGPLGGALSTPPAFEAETGTAALYTRLRRLDAWRLRRDPWLRRGYAEAALVLGVAPYMAGLLSPVPLKRFETVLELGIDDLPPLPARPADPGRLNLLHVGRGVRTKGLRDAVRALGHLADLPHAVLTSAGEGEEIDLCREEARRLGVADRVRFLGRIPRAQVEELYREADLFLFPSFREPAGNVLYEAQRWGLPCIAADRGGPAFIVDDENGIRVPVTDPETYPRDLAAAVRRLSDPDLRARMGAAARRRLAKEALWPAKAEALLALWRDVLDRGAGPGCHPAPPAAEGTPSSTGNQPRGLMA